MRETRPGAPQERLAWTRWVPKEAWDARMELPPPVWQSRREVSAGAEVRPFWRLDRRHWPGPRRPEPQDLELKLVPLKSQDSAAPPLEPVGRKLWGPLARRPQAVRTTPKAQPS